MHKKFFVISLVAAAAVGAFGYFVLPELAGLTDPAYRVVFGAILTMAVFATATTWYLLTSLSAFKFATRRAYYIIAAGVMLYALAQLEQVGIILVFTFLPAIVVSDFVANALFLVPYLASSFALYFGLKALAGVLSIKTWPVYLVLATATILAFCSLLLPHTLNPDASLELTAKIIFGISSLGGVLSGAAALVALRIRSTIGTAYRLPMAWLVVAVGILSLASLQEVIVKGTDIINSLYVAYSLDILPFLLAGLFFMKAGQSLKSASLQILPGNATYIDAVIYTAQLVSTPQGVNAILNRLRQITARLQSGGLLAATDKEGLLGIYYDLENYLITKEPLLNLTRESLRSRLTTEFQQELLADKKLVAAASPK